MIYRIENLSKESVTVKNLIFANDGAKSTPFSAFYEKECTSTRACLARYSVASKLNIRASIHSTALNFLKCGEKAWPSSWSNLGPSDVLRPHSVATTMHLPKIPEHVIIRLANKVVPLAARSYTVGVVGSASSPAGNLAEN